VIATNEDYRELIQNLGKKCVKLFVVPKNSMNDSMSVISKGESQENF